MPRVQRKKRPSKRYNPMTQSLDMTKVALSRPTTAHLPNTVQLLPTELYTYGKVMIPGQLSGATNTTWTFRANSAGFKYGPQVNYTGVFNVESPAGLFYLFGSSSGSGSNAPYSRMWTLSSEIDVQFINYGTIPVECTIIPSTQATYSGSSTSTLAEQYGAISRIYPPVTSTTQNLRANFDWASVIGVDKRTYESVTDYSQIAGNNPPNSVFWHIQWVSTDNATNFLGSVKIVVRHYIKLAGMQQLISQDPMLSREAHISDNNNNNTSMVVDDTFVYVPPRCGIKGCECDKHFKK